MGQHSDGVPKEKDDLISDLLARKKNMPIGANPDIARDLTPAPIWVVEKVGNRIDLMLLIWKGRGFEVGRKKIFGSSA